MLTRSPDRETASNEIAILGAFCLFLSAIEYMIPKPLPFFRIGLANLPLMLACNFFSLPSYLILICIKVFGQALITGTLFSYVFLFSMSGTFLSALCMFFLSRVFTDKRISFVGIGTAGALVSNLSQLCFAYFFIFRENVLYIAPPFLAAGLVTGIVLGMFCAIFANKSKWYSQMKEHGFTRNNTEKFHGLTQINTDRVHGFTRINTDRVHGFTRIYTKEIKIYDKFFSARALFITGLIIMPAFLFNPSAELRICQFLFFLILACFSGRKINFLYTILIMAFIVAFNLIIPYGRVLYSIGAFKITSGALSAGIHRAVTLQALIMLSKFTIRNDLALPGTFGRLLGKSLQIFTELTDKKLRLTRNNIIAEMDALLINLDEENNTPSEIKKHKTKPIGYVLLAIIVFLSWLPWGFL